MTLDLKQFDEFEVTSLERKALVRLSTNKDFELLSIVLLRWLMWRAHMLASNPSIDETQDMQLINIQGGHAVFKKLLELVNGKDNE